MTTTEQKPSPTRPQAGWIVAGHFHRDDELPPPFDSVKCESHNIGASVWIHLSSGAMVAAIPTGRWKDAARFAFYYSAPNAAVAVPLQAWTGDQQGWDGSNPNAYTAHHERAIAYLNSVVGQAATSEPGSCQ